MVDDRPQRPEHFCVAFPITRQFYAYSVGKFSFAERLALGSTCAVISDGKVFEDTEQMPSGSRQSKIHLAETHERLLVAQKSKCTARRAIRRHIIVIANAGLKEYENAEMRLTL